MQRRATPRIFLILSRGELAGRFIAWEIGSVRDAPYRPETIRETRRGEKNKPKIQTGARTGESVSRARCWESGASLNNAFRVRVCSVDRTSLCIPADRNNERNGEKEKEQTGARFFYCEKRQFSFGARTRAAAWK